MMNRLIIVLLIMIDSSCLLGQMLPITDHYVYNFLAINPAYAGCDDALSASILYRNQWIGFKDAPKNWNLSFHTPYFHDRIGLGLLIEYNSIGIFKKTSLMGNYAYRMELYNGKLAFGLGFGIDFYQNKWNELVASDTDDPILTDNPTSVILPAFSLGIYYYTAKYFIGISLPRFINSEYDQSSNKYKVKNDFSAYNYYFTGGYRFKISSKTELLPSVLIKYHPGHVVQFDCNAQFILKDKVWFGVGYRSNDIIIGMLQYQLNSQLSLAYSYDFNLGKIGAYNSGSHELVLNYLFSYKRLVVGPRQL